MTEFMLNAAIKGTIVLAAAWVATALLSRASADLRHRIWLAGLAGLTLLLIPAPLPDPVRITVSAALDSSAASAEAARMPLLTPLWFIGTSLALARLAFGLLRLFRLTRAAAPAGPMRVTDGVASPLTWGVFRPDILVPSFVLDWPVEQRALVLAHERAHIARRDWLWQTLAQVLCAILWFHPLVWLAAARLRDEAERATDDAVLASGAGAAGYAARLLEVARRVHRRAAPTAVTVPMVRRPAITARISAILDARNNRTPAGRPTRAAIGAAAVASALLLAACAGPRVYRVGADVQAPVVIEKPQPEYTPAARDGRVAGTVQISLVVTPSGKADQVRVIKPLDPDLDQNAVNAIKRWRFQPGTKDGKPVPVRATIAVNFGLK